MDTRALTSAFTIICLLSLFAAPCGGDEAATKKDPDALSEAERLRDASLGDLTPAQRLDRDIRFLASEELRGRAVGTKGLDEAAEAIAKRFAELGLRTSLYDDKPFQYFTVDTGVDVGDAEKNWMRVTRSGEEPITLELGKTFNPLSLGSSGEVSGELVFVGYGITSPQASYDEYAGIDTRGKIVVVIRKEPRSGRQDNPLGKRSPTAAAYFSTKVLNAITHGAAGIIIVNDRKTVEDLQRRQQKRRGTGSDPEHAILKVTQAGKGTRGKKIPSVSVSRKVMDELVQKTLGKSLVQIEESIDAKFAPESQLMTGVEVSFSTDLKKSDVRAKNVIAELPGTGSLAQETVVVGAHYDHVGMGGMGSLAPGTIEVHNGADDNASGTAALLEIARALTQSEDENRRRIVFIAFTGEERGLLGSAHYVREPRFDLEKTVAMFNLDMVGRLKGNHLSVYGTGTASNFDSMIESVNQQFKFRLDKDPSGYGPSDHQSFYEKKIPVLHFFTGLHNDYHRPSDDFDKINLSGLARITDMVVEVTHQAATSLTAPQYQSTKRGAGIRTQKSAFLGVQLRMENDMLTVSSVVPEGPAARAGLLAGDTLLQADTKNLGSVPDLLNLLSKRSGGQTLELQVRRDSQTFKLKVALGER